MQSDRAAVENVQDIGEFIASFCFMNINLFIIYGGDIESSFFEALYDR